MNKCPHCGAEPCLPLWRKLSLGPVASAPCRVCGYRVIVDFYRAWAATLPALLIIIVLASGELENPLPAVALLVVFLVLAFVLYTNWVPLRRAELTNASMVEAGRARIAAENAAKTGQAQG